MPKNPDRAAATASTGPTPSSELHAPALSHLSTPANQSDDRSDISYVNVTLETVDRGLAKGGGADRAAVLLDVALVVLLGVIEGRGGHDLGDDRPPP
jgi:hypothetical protein